ncbi:MAG: carboxypeptidase regulatory-like domain-containing protein [Acidobacteriota bacterium]
MRYVLAIAWLALAGFLPQNGAAPPTPTGTLEGTLQSVWIRKYPMIVYLEKVDGAFQPASEKPIIDQKDKMFVPHLLPVLRGTTVEYVNHDDTKHNVYVVPPDGKRINLGTGMEGWARDLEMDENGVYVHRCNIHDEMSAYVVVLDNPYYAFIKKGAGRSAAFRLEGVPPGNYKLHVWCEKFYSQEGNKFNRTWEVSVKAGETTAVNVKP